MRAGARPAGPRSRRPRAKTAQPPRRSPRAVPPLAPEASVGGGSRPGARAPATGAVGGDGGRGRAPGVVHFREPAGPERVVDTVTVLDEQVDVDEGPGAIRIPIGDLGSFQEQQRAVDDLSGCGPAGDRRHHRRRGRAAPRPRGAWNRIAVQPQSPRLLSGRACSPGCPPGRRAQAGRRPRGPECPVPPRHGRTIVQPCPSCVRRGSSPTRSEPRAPPGTPPLRRP